MKTRETQSRHSLHADVLLRLARKWRKEAELFRRELGACIAAADRAQATASYRKLEYCSAGLERLAQQNADISDRRWKGTMESKTDSLTPATSEPASAAPVRVQPGGSAIRPHDQQTPLERVLRSHLWYPNDILARGAKELSKCLKAKEYRQAADWQELMRKAESDKKDWEYLLELYEQERQSQNAEPNEAADSGHPKAQQPQPAAFTSATG